MRGARSARRARRRLYSQNFLRSTALARELVRDAALAPGDVVVDIGAGSGRLTHELAGIAATVYALEVDAAWASRLRERFASRANVVVVEADVLEWPLPREPFRVVANLPFHQTAAVLRYLLDDPQTALRGADVIVEWGAAVKRATLWPSTLVGVSWGAWYTFAVARRLPPACFEPPPLVDAGVLTIRRRPSPLVPDDERDAFCTFVRCGFSAPNVAVRRALAPLLSPRRFNRLADRLAVPRDARARELDPHQWAGLFAAAQPVRPAR